MSHSAKVMLSSKHSLFPDELQMCSIFKSTKLVLELILKTHPYHSPKCDSMATPKENAVVSHDTSNFVHRGTKYRKSDMSNIVTEKYAWHKPLLGGELTYSGGLDKNVTNYNHNSSHSIRCMDVETHMTQPH